MKKIVLSLCFVSLISLFFSCSDKEDPDGKWDDNIKLSTKSAEFSADADSITITTKGTGWWINYITVNSKTYYYDNEDADLAGLYNYSFQGDGVVVERRDTTRLFIKADANSSSTEKVITVSLEAGDYFDDVKITQAAQ